MGKDDSTISMNIKVGDQSFRIRVRPDEKALYEEIARLTDATFKDISEHALTGGSKAWAMTAFQIATDLVEAQHAGNGGSPAPRDDARIKQLIRRIEEVTLNN